MPDFFPRYERAADGSLVYRLDESDEGHTRVSDSLGLLYEVHVPLLHRHGTARAVKARYDLLRAAWIAAGLDISGLRFVEIPVARIDDDTLEQIAKLMSICDYAARFDTYITNRIAAARLVDFTCATAA